MGRLVPPVALLQSTVRSLGELELALRPEPRALAGLNLERLVEEKSRQLVEAERFAAIGETVAGLAHGIKNIAGGLKGGGFVLEKGLELDNREYLLQGWEMIRGNVEKIRKLSLDLLEFSTPAEPKRKACDPNRLAAEAVTLMTQEAKTLGIALEFKPADGLGDMTGVGDTIERLFQGLKQSLDALVVLVVILVVFIVFIVIR